MNITVASILCGALSGLLFGCSFVYQQRSIFIAKQLSLFKLMSIFIGRIMLLMVFGYYLLPLPLFSSILGLTSFVIAYWVTILTLKARGYARL